MESPHQTLLFFWAAGWQDNAIMSICFLEKNKSIILRQMLSHHGCSKVTPSTSGHKQESLDWKSTWNFCIFPKILSTLQTFFLETMFKILYLGRKNHHISQKRGGNDTRAMKLYGKLACKLSGGPWKFACKVSREPWKFKGKLSRVIETFKANFQSNFDKYLFPYCIPEGLATFMANFQGEPWKFHWKLAGVHWNFACKLSGCPWNFACKFAINLQRHFLQQVFWTRNLWKKPFTKSCPKHLCTSNPKAKQLVKHFFPLYFKSSTRRALQPISLARQKKVSEIAT